MNKLTNLLLLTWVVSIASFTTPTRRQAIVPMALKSTQRDNGDFPPEESGEYTGSVDWDAEWKKVVASEKSTTGLKERPGKDFYKSEAEIAAIKAANKAAEQAAQASSSVVNALPDIRSLSGDWKFWIGILAVISVGLSLLSAPSADMIPSNDGSYYI
mmetsp:Transcript_129898/g.363564  ORF Transcript_129898/g.363564 Transcript_129898/m.363564 type:complete len:158 (-) Transcript_129898:260-733(-)